MSIAAAYRSDRLGLSFELFPPKTEQGEAAMMLHVERLMQYRPDFVTCTYGAGGSTQSKTLQIVSNVHKKFKVPVATHLTCVGRTCEQLQEYLSEAIDKGVENVVALRGDPPQGDAQFTQTKGGFRYANELVAMIRREFPSLGIAVAGYPEVHQEAPTPESDLENLKRKVDSGANAVITQLFYDNQDFFRFRDKCKQLGITAPIVPGLLPITNTAQIKRITSLCGARLPADLIDRLEAAGDDSDAQFEAGVEIATRQTVELIERGVPGIHYYVLNKSDAASRVLESIGLRR